MIEDVFEDVQLSKCRGKEVMMDVSLTDKHYGTRVRRQAVEERSLAGSGGSASAHESGGDAGGEQLQSQYTCGS